MQKTDGDAFDVPVLQRTNDCARLLLVQRRDDLAFGIESLGHFEAQFPRHQRRRRLVKKIVDVFPAAATQLEDVTETLGRDQPDAGAVLLHDRVDHHRRAVHDHAEFGRFEAQLFGPFEELFLERAGRTNLLDRHLAGLRVEGYEVDKGAADIDGEPPGIRHCYYRRSQEGTLSFVPPS